MSDKIRYKIDGKDVCPHMYHALKELQNLVNIWSEFGDEGWVNVECKICGTIRELVVSDRHDSQQPVLPD